MRVTKKGGKIFLFDLFIEGYQRLGELREKHRLRELIQPQHCLPLDDQFIETVLDSTSLKTVSVDDPTSSYYLLTRVYIPRLLRLFNTQPESTSLLNHIASFVPSFGNLGVNRLYVFEKNGN